LLIKEPQPIRLTIPGPSLHRFASNLLVSGWYPKFPLETDPKVEVGFRPKPTSPLNQRD
jgi:hypothetical protein